MIETGLQVIDSVTLFRVDSESAAFEFHGAVLGGMD
jgi:hypothetical protein